MRDDLIKFIEHFGFHLFGENLWILRGDYPGQSAHIYIDTEEIRTTIVTSKNEKIADSIKIDENVKKKIAHHLNKNLLYKPTKLL